MNKVFMLNESQRYNSLQMLRGAAAVFVMLYHATRHYENKDLTFLSGFFQHGYLGVDIFFVLSGFVIYSSSLKYFSSHDIKTYLAKRFIRIYVPYWIFLFLPLLFLFIFKPQFIQNAYAFSIDYVFKLIFLTFNHPEVSQITWTLSFEIYFYLLFIGFVLFKWYRYFIFLLICVIIINYVNPTIFGNGVVGKYMLSTLVLEFFFGIIIALIYKNKISFNPKILLVFSLLLFVVFVFLHHQNIINIYTKSNRFLFLGFASFLLIYSLLKTEQLYKIKIPNIFIKIGDSSYILYLIHSVLISFFNNQIILSNKFVVINQQISTILACLFIIFLSILLHEKIESPVLNHLNDLFIKQKNVTKQQRFE